MQITKNMTIAEVLDIDERLTDVFANFGMHCVGCPSFRLETLEEACLVHSIDYETLVKELNLVLDN